MNPADQSRDDTSRGPVVSLQQQAVRPATPTFTAATPTAAPPPSPTGLAAISRATADGSGAAALLVARLVTLVSLRAPACTAHGASASRPPHRTRPALPTTGGDGGPAQRRPGGGGSGSGRRVADGPAGRARVRGPPAVLAGSIMAHGSMAGMVETMGRRGSRAHAGGGRPRRGETIDGRRRVER